MAYSCCFQSQARKHCRRGYQLYLRDGHYGRTRLGTPRKSMSSGAPEPKLSVVSWLQRQAWRYTGRKCVASATRPPDLRQSRRPTNPSSRIGPSAPPGPAFSVSRNERGGAARRVRRPPPRLETAHACPCHWTGCARAHCGPPRRTLPLHNAHGHRVCPGRRPVGRTALRLWRDDGAAPTFGSISRRRFPGAFCGGSHVGHYVGHVSPCPYAIPSIDSLFVCRNALGAGFSGATITPPAAVR